MTLPEALAILVRAEKIRHALRPGMIAADPAGTVWILGFDSIWRNSRNVILDRSTQLAPLLLSPATRGCLLDIAREAWGSAHYCTASDGRQWYFGIWAISSQVVSDMVRGGMLVVASGATEADVLVAAIIAAAEALEVTP